MSGASRSSAPSSTPVLDCLGHGASGASLLATARRLLALETCLRRHLPPGLANTCRVAGLDDQQVLSIAVPSAAHASRLRQILSSTQAALQSDGWSVAGIRPRIIAGLGSVTPPRPRETIPLDGGALEAFSQLHGTLRAGPLADAVGRLLARHGWTDASQEKGPDSVSRT